jgi:hypothetical protein
MKPSRYKLHPPRQVVSCRQEPHAFDRQLSLAARLTSMHAYKMPY